MKLLSIILLTGALLATNAIAEPKKKVLIVASNMINMGDPEQHDARNNLWEFAPPYHIFLATALKLTLYHLMVEKLSLCWSL